MHHRWQPTENILTSLLLFSFIINFSLSWLEWLYSLFRPFVSVPFVSFPPFSCDRSATGCRPVDDDQFGATERNVSRTDRSYHAPTIRRTSSLPPVRSRILAQKNVFPPFWAYSIELSLSLSFSLDRETRQRFVDFPRDQAETLSIRGRTCARGKRLFILAFGRVMSSTHKRVYKTEREKASGPCS